MKISCKLLEMVTHSAIRGAVKNIVQNDCEPTVREIDNVAMAVACRFGFYSDVERIKTEQVKWHFCVTLRNPSLEKVVKFSIID